MEINEKFESDTLTKIIPALMKAQKEMGKIELDSRGNYGGYASITSCFNSIKPALLSNDINFSQPIIDIDGTLYIYTILRHISGEYLKSRVALIRTPDNNMQKLGGQITYARRYAILCIMGAVGDEDDDGQKQADELTFIDDKELNILNREFDGWPKLKALIMGRCKLEYLKDVKKSDFEGMMNAIKGVKAKNGTDK